MKTFVDIVKKAFALLIAGPFIAVLTMIVAAWLGQLVPRINQDAETLFWLTLACLVGALGVAIIALWVWHFLELGVVWATFAYVYLFWNWYPDNRAHVWAVRLIDALLVLILVVAINHWRKDGALKPKAAGNHGGDHH